MAVDKKRIEDLMNRLSEKDLELVTDLIERLAFNTFRDIPLDDEPLTEEDMEAIKKAKESFARGEGIKFEDVKDDLFN